MELSQRQSFKDLGHLGWIDLKLIRYLYFCFLAQDCLLKKTKCEGESVGRYKSKSFVQCSGKYTAFEKNETRINKHFFLIQTIVQRRRTNVDFGHSPRKRVLVCVTC